MIFFVRSQLFYPTSKIKNKKKRNLVLFAPPLLDHTQHHCHDTIACGTLHHNYHSNAIACRVIATIVTTLSHTLLSSPPCSSICTQCCCRHYTIVITIVLPLLLNPPSFSQSPKEFSSCSFCSPLQSLLVFHSHL